MDRVLKERQDKQGKEDVDMEDVLDGLSKKARDHSRTPMQVRLVNFKCRSFKGVQLFASGIPQPMAGSPRGPRGCG
jgi:hypothetical protein